MQIHKYKSAAAHICMQRFYRMVNEQSAAASAHQKHHLDLIVPAVVFHDQHLIRSDIQSSELPVEGVRWTCQIGKLSCWMLARASSQADCYTTPPRRFKRGCESLCWYDGISQSSPSSHCSQRLFPSCFVKSHTHERNFRNDCFYWRARSEQMCARI